MHTQKYAALFGTEKPLIAMIHVQALPGTPANCMSVEQIAAQAVDEARVLVEAGVDAIMLENMHDAPYLNRQVGPEIVAAMTRVAVAVRQAVALPLGIQILAGANHAALAVALAAGLQFIRGEGFVFSHVADEGLMHSDAGSLLRYRKAMLAEQIQVFTDIKKKHSAHAISADVSLEDTCHAAEFFLSDGVIITGSATGQPVKSGELESVHKASSLPVLVGSGVTPENLPRIWAAADGFIVGSYFKQHGDWRQGPDPVRVRALVEARQALLGQDA